MKALIKKLLREGLFGDDDFNVPNHGKIIHEEKVSKEIPITLYRGLRTQFDNSKPHPELIDKGENYLLEVDKFPDKLIWFTRDGEFAKGYSGWGLITYELLVIKHSKILTYEDGYKINEFGYGNENIESGFGRGIISANPYKLSPLHYGIELPDHWFWSYKTEKHIVCDSDLLIPKNKVEVKKL